MKNIKVKKISYVVLIISAFLFAIVSIRTDFFKKNFFLDTYSYDNLQFPERYDLRNVSGYNYTSPPKNQFWAACWAFASVGTLESNMMIHNGNSSYYLDYNNDGIYEDSSHVLDFSERQIDYFISSEIYYEEGYNPYTMFNHLVARGGSFTNSEAAFASGLSPILQSKWKYPTEEVTVNNADVFDSKNVDYFVTETIRVPSISERVSQEVKDRQTKIIKYHVMNYGGVAFAGPSGDASMTCFDRELRLYTYSPDCDVVGGHAMTIIGWDDDYGPNHVGAWLIRNGLLSPDGDPEEAFFYMAYSFDSVTELFQVKSVKERDWDNDYNKTKKFDFKNKNVSGTKIYEIKYYKDSETEKLKYINFIAGSSDSSFNVYVSRTGNEADYQFVGTVTKEFPGLVTLEINNDIVLSDNSFSIKIETSQEVALPNYGNPTYVSYIQAFTTNYNVTEERSISLDYQLDGNILSSINPLRLNIFTRNIDISERPSLLGIYNSNNENVMNLFNLDINSYYNNYGFMDISIVDNIPLDTYTFKVGYQDIYEEISIELSSIDHTVFDSGIGTDDSPYVVSTLGQLLMINTQKYYLQASYVLANDIDISECKNAGSSCYNNGKGWTPIGNNTDKFTGNFNGNNHVISGLYINSGDSYVGFFGATNKSTIKNLVFENAYVKGSYNIGILSGYASSGSISNIRTNGDVIGNTNVGGILGSSNSSLSKLANEAQVRANIKGGGLVGYYSADISMSDSFNIGNVSGQYAGGLFGYVSSFSAINISNSYNAGNITGTSSAGGIVGYIERSGVTVTLDNIYNIGNIYSSGTNGQIIGTMSDTYTLNFNGLYIIDNEVNGIGNVLYGLNGNEYNAISKDEFIVESSFDEFDFDSVWEIKNQNAYPTIRSNPYNYIANIIVEEDHIEIAKGGTCQLEYTIIPNNASNKELNYSIEAQLSEEDDSGRKGGGNSPVISILDDGLITAKALGNAIVTISAMDNSYPVKVLYIDVVSESSLCKSSACSQTSVEGIEFSQENVTIEVSEEYTLEYTITPSDATDKSVTFSSSDNNVVTVDENGKIRGINSGNATITVTTVDGGYTDSVNVNVVVPVTGIEFNTETLNLKRGQLVNLEYTIFPNNATDRRVIFNSLDESVAMTDIFGRIMGINEGTTTVTVTTLDGEYSDTLTVIVTNPVRGIELSQENVTIEVSEEYALEYTITPSDATDKRVTFSSSDNNVVTVDENGKIRGINSGNATITVTTVDGEYTDSVNVVIKEKVTLSSETYTIKDDFTIIIPDLVTREMFNNNIYSSYTISFSENSEYIGTGNIISISEGTLLRSSYQVIVFGDVDGNGIIDTVDVNSLIEYIYRNNSLLSWVFLKAADYNSDGKYSLSDIMKISKKSLERE